LPLEMHRQAAHKIATVQDTSSRREQPAIGQMVDVVDYARMTLVFYRCDLKVAEMIVCRKDEFIRRAVPSALPYEAWREGNDSSWNPPTTYPAIERSASEPRGDGAAASIRVARGQG
jgi:hypothetical protein